MLSNMQLLFFTLQIILLLVAIVSGKSFKDGNSHEKFGQRFAMEPQDQTAIIGSHVTLPCRVIDKQGVLQWTKDDFGLGMHRNLSGFERYSMVGSDEEGDFSLDIYPVMLDDDARFQCQVSPGRDGTPAIRSRFAKLSILVPPDNPKIIQGSHMSTTEDREIELECVSYGGKPAAEITWIDGLGNVLTKGIHYFKKPIENSKLFEAKSILKFIPKKEHHNTSFTCQAQNTADRNYKSTKLRLEVKFAPKVTVTIAGGALAGGRIQEGSDVRFLCHAEANPPEVTYRWFVDDVKIVGDHKTELIIHNVSRDLHDSIVKCEVYNIVGKSEESETLDISYGPTFKQRPRSIEVDEGSTVTLTCDVDGNPIPEIVWIYETSDRKMQVVGTSTNLTMTVTSENAGRYYCKATVMGFPEIGAEATIFLKGPPSITSTRRQYGTPGDVSKIECIAFSIPKARHVSWSYNGHELNASNDDDFQVTEDYLPFGVKSTLLIKESMSKHFGRYNCTVLNDYGYDILEIELTGENNSQFFYIIFGGVVSFIFLIMFLTSCILCKKKTKKKLPPADVITDHHLSKGCKESDCSSNKSDIKINRENEYLETCSATDLSQTRIPMNSFGVSLTGGMPDFRYSGDYTDSFQTTKLGIHNNGYVPYVDYNRDYIPPPQSLTLNNRSNHTSLTNHLIVSTSSNTVTNAPVITSASILGISNGPLTNNTYSLTRVRHNINQDNGLPYVPTSLSSIQNGTLNQSLLNIDPRYSATYGNPFLKNSNTSIFPPNTANPAITPAPPPYNASRGSNSNSSFSSSTTISNVNGGGSVVGIGGGLHVATSNAGSSPPLTQPSQTPSPSSGHISSGHITLPSNAKIGALATHV